LAVLVLVDPYSYAKFDPFVTNEGLQFKHVSRLKELAKYRH